MGCIPSKALLNASHMYEEAKHSFSNFGIKGTVSYCRVVCAPRPVILPCAVYGGMYAVDNVQLDLPVMMDMKGKAVKGLTQGIEGLFKKNKVLLRIYMTSL